MRNMRQTSTMAQYKSMMGFTQAFLMLISIALIGIGVFDYLNEGFLNLGNGALVLVFLGCLILLVGLLAPLAELFNLTRLGAWVGAFFVVSVLVILVAIITMAYEGGNLFG